MKIAIIGMSGSGKTYWSKKLESKGFKRFGCDDLIEEKLGKELKSLGYSGIRNVAKWMGQPFDKQYPKTSKKYLQFEGKVIEKILSSLQTSSKDENIVIDTTGSVIYLEESLLNKLIGLTKIIYLETPAYVKQKMYKLYLKNPKPVIWGESFIKEQNETDFEALAKCYSNLLTYRTREYKKIANITLNYQTLHNSSHGLNEFMEIIR